MSRRRDVSRELLRRVLAVEIGHLTLGASVAQLAVPGALMRDIRHLTRGMSRDDCLIMLGHLSAMVRMFAAEVPVARRDQMLAELEDLDRVIDAGVG